MLMKPNALNMSNCQSTRAQRVLSYHLIQVPCKIRTYAAAPPSMTLPRFWLFALQGKPFLVFPSLFFQQLQFACENSQIPITFHLHCIQYVPKFHPKTGRSMLDLNPAQYLEYFNSGNICTRTQIFCTRQLHTF